MSFERFSDNIHNFRTLLVLGAGVLTAATAVAPGFGAEARLAVHRTIDSDFDARFTALNDQDKTEYRQGLRNDFAEDSVWFAGHAVTSFFVFFSGAQEAKRRRERRGLNNP